MTAGGDLLQQIMSLRELYAPKAAPDYNPEEFAKDVNCYGYALNLVDHGWATPGRLTEFEHQQLDQLQITQPFITSAIGDDGLEQVREHGARRDEHVIAGYVIPTKDFHFYRFDNDGNWSSKYASKPVEQTPPPLDEDETFIGYFRVPKEGILYTPRLKIISTLEEFGLK